MKLQTAREHTVIPLPLSVRVGLIIWRNLPLLLLLDLILCLAAIPAVVLFIEGLPLLAPWAAALILGPTWTATSAIANSLHRDEQASLRDFISAVRVYWRRAIAVSCVPALVATAMSGTLLILQAYPHASWLYISLFVDGIALSLLVLASIPVFSLATSSQIGVWSLWKTSLALVVVRPFHTLGTLLLLLLVGLLVNWLNAALLPMLAAPLAVYFAATTQNTLQWLQECKIREK